VNPNDNVHVNVHDLIRENRKRLRLTPNVLAHTILNIQKIIARRQRYSIVSIFVRCNPRDFFLFVLPQDDQWVISVRFRSNLWARHFIGPISIVQKLIPILGISILAVVVAKAQDPAKVDSAHYEMILNNQHVRVLDVHHKPGEKSPMHSRPLAVDSSDWLSPIRMCSQA
jgi:hypothetical protein